MNLSSVNVRSNFSRFEFKFVEEAQKLCDFMASLSDFIEYDENSKGLDNGYRVDSIYFDCSRLKDYADKEEALFKRGKFRLRSYGNIFTTDPVFLEYNGKIGDYVAKERLSLSRVDTNVILNTSMFDFFSKRLWSWQKDIVKEGLFRPTLYPKTIVSYYRKAAFFAYDRRVRLTLDTNVRANQYKKSYHREGLFPLRGGLAVLEIKFDKKMPMVLNERIKSFGLARKSNSKAALSFSENHLYHG
jgi:hypothetical protein